MGCNALIAGWQSPAGGAVKFGAKPSPGYVPLKVPCGMCTGCRIERSRQWAVRCVHEAQLHDENCFITLTYNDQELPLDGSLRKGDLQKFFDRLRKKKGPFRYYACGEYGDHTKRAHYHACIFGLDFADKTDFRKIGQNTLYISAELTELWGHGHTSIGNLTYETAAYTARYVMKKGLGKNAGNFVRLDEETGELIKLQQPFALMSLGRGKGNAIGGPWLQKYHTDIYNKDYFTIRGRKMRSTKYYDKVYDTINAEHLQQIKKKRIEERPEITENEYRAREKIARARIINRKQV